MTGRQTKTIQWTINLPMDFPSDWDDDMIEFHLNESNWCCSNLITVHWKICDWKSKILLGKYKEDWHSDYDMGTVGLGVLTGCAIVGGIVIILCQTFDIVTCITFPEKVIIEELQSVYSSLK